MARGGWRYGAGRPGWHILAEQCLQIDVRELARREMLAGGSFTWRWTNTRTGELVGAISITTWPGEARLHYLHDGQPVSDRVEIAPSACHYGGTRPWFLCPRCSRRVAVLFLRSGRFKCRHCSQVAYASQSEDVIGRAWRRQAKLEARLGANWQRPKGMHHETRDKLVTAILACEELREFELAAFIERNAWAFP